MYNKYKIAHMKLAKRREKLILKTRVNNIYVYEIHYKTNDYFFK